MPESACQFSWCEAIFPGHKEHDSSRYVPASLSGPHRNTLTVGAGLAIDDGEGPRIFVHIVDDGDVDEDAYMTIDEAVDLIDVLIAAIANARSVPAGAGVQ